MPDLTVRIFDKMDSMNDSMTEIREDVSALNERTSGLRAMGEDVAALKIQVDKIGEPVSKDSAETMIAASLNQHRADLHGTGPVNKAYVSAKTKLILAIAGLATAGAAAFASYLVR